jgi:hypothetical protein
MTLTTYDAIRSALGKDQSEAPDDELEFDKELAEGIVTDELDPYSSNTDALEDTAALLAAAYYTGEGTVGQMSQGSQQVSFTDGALGYWRKAKMRDPTGRLEKLEKQSASISVPEVK